MFNPSITRHETLHNVLHRLAWLYDEGDLEKVVNELSTKGVCYTDARGGGTIRTRLVAFGRASEVGLNVVPIGIILEAVTELLEHYDDVLRSAKLSSPAAETLKLLKKTGFEISRDP